MRKVIASVRPVLLAGLSVVLVVAVAITLQHYFWPRSASLGVAAAQGKGRDAPNSQAASGAAVNSATISGQSLYQLNAVWTTDHDRTLKLVDFQGRYTVLALIYTQCSGTCPLLVKQLQVFAASLPPNIKERIQFVAVSIDPDDTSASLSQYRQEMRLDEHEWTLLRGAPIAVRELAAVVGFNYAQTSEQSGVAQYSHSNLLTVLNPRGEIVHQQQGAGSNLGDLIAVIRHPT